MTASIWDQLLSVNDVTRDAARMPALRAVGQRRRAYLEAVGSVLAEGFEAGDGQLLRAAIAMALGSG